MESDQVSRPRTRKPCPGCGVAAGLRYADTVCRTCRRRLDAAIAAEQAQRDADADLPEAVEHVYLPTTLLGRSHDGWGKESYPRLAGLLTFEQAAQLDGLLVAVMDALFPERCPSLSVPHHYGTVPRDYIERAVGGHQTIVAKGTRRQVLALNQLCDGLREALRLAHLRGEQRTDNLLLGLAEGRYAMADLTEVERRRVYDQQEAGKLLARCRAALGEDATDE